MLGQKSGFRARVMEVAPHVKFFQQSNKCKTLVTSLRDDFFILILAYLVDNFDAQNMLNKNLQGKDLTVCEFIAKVKAFLAKLGLITCSQS